MKSHTAELSALPSAPLHARIKNTLRARILDGSAAPLSQLPSESELGAAFGASRITVRQALGDLEKERVIFKVPGKGSFVAPATFSITTGCLSSSPSLVLTRRAVASTPPPAENGTIIVMGLEG